MFYEYDVILEFLLFLLNFLLIIALFALFFGIQGACMVFVVAIALVTFKVFMDVIIFCVTIYIPFFIH